MRYEGKRLTVLIVIALFFMSCAVAVAAEAQTPFPKTAGAALIQPVEKPKGAIDLSTAIVRVANQTMPAVVYIEVTESRVVENPLGPFENDPFFRRFFGIPKTPRKFKQEMKGLGSGMIITAQGDILTNYHVAGGATKIQVTLADGSQYPATLVGGDAKTDLAVIRISAGKTASLRDLRGFRQR